ncbi:aminotransferase class I/II-fold pyridoxal phosphate-dependent enzyme [Epidermidibacterium keratini]|uniref:Aminotransferase class I/II-fold pyridoxal phosphate-dependent enzyme n=1 Tax=Epidermidibacterium keratini TaxID=1891644 RepID=A0A7L4YN42_9ACTN|nr:DegT/DnrJ/EryC1/StrS family aminotransferase [Epidermidibacterium keratini]QHC00695.1 aminotransferase class I/II-fold pyridoxal phosphate-dependent enzyme [Epidermidibacterium keratini]
MATNIPAASPIIGDEERAAVDRVMRSGMIAQGPEVAAFEGEFAELAGGVTCVAVNSGTSALHMGLIAAGVRPGDEVIVPSFTFAATGNAVALVGATPVFVDVEEDYFCLDPAAVEAAVTDKTVGIMPVHLYGHPANMAALQQIADKHGLAIYEDAAQAHGAEFDGTRVGSFGKFAAFSLYPTKNMTSGEGGMVSTADEDLARTVRLLRNQGMEKRYENELVGFNTRMTDIHAAIGRVQLGKLDGWTKTRQQNAKFLDENLSGVIVPPVADNATHVYHQYTIRVDAADRDAFVAGLGERGVGSGVYYPIPTHALPSFGLDLDLPTTARVAKEVISLPVHPALQDGDLEKVVAAVNELASAGA